MRSIFSKKLLLIIGIPLILVAGILIVLFAIPSFPISPLHMCTLIGCRDSLELTFSHEPPGQYNVLLTTSTGETRNVSCNNSEISSVDATVAMCRSGVVTVYDFTPADVTIVVSWQGGRYSTNGAPTYTSFQPNGPDCPPTCRSGKLTIELP